MFFWNPDIICFIMNSNLSKDAWKQLLVGETANQQWCNLPQYNAYLDEWLPRQVRM